MNQYVVMNKGVVRRWVEDGFGAGDVALADELIAADFVNHTPQPGQQPGRTGVKHAVLALRGSFADLSVTVCDILAEHDCVVVRDVIRGRHVGDFAGVPASGKHVAVRRLAFYTLRDGQIAEHWAQLDMLGLLQQLGAAPGVAAPPGEPAAASTGDAAPEDAAANKLLVRRLFEEGLSPGDMAIVDDLVAADLALHGVPPELPPGRGGLKALLGMFRSAFPDYRDALEQTVAEDDRVAVRWTFQGTHKGSLQGIPPTGKQARIGGMSLFRVRDGQIVEDWTEMDLLGLLHQITPVSFTV